MYVSLQGRSNGRHVTINPDGSIAFRWAASGRGCDGCGYCQEVRDMIRGRLRSRNIEFSDTGDYWMTWKPDIDVTEETLVEYLSQQVGLPVH